MAVTDERDLFTHHDFVCAVVALRQVAPNRSASVAEISALVGAPVDVTEEVARRIIEAEDDRVAVSYLSERGLSAAPRHGDMKRVEFRPTARGYFTALRGQHPFNG